MGERLLDVPAPSSGSGPAEADADDVEDAAAGRACRAEADRYRAALGAARGARRRPAGAVSPSAAAEGRVELIASAATHAVLPLLATDAGPPAADRRRACARTGAASASRRASGCPSARTSPGSSGCSPSAGWASSAPTRARTRRRSARARAGRDRGGPVALHDRLGGGRSGCGRSRATRPIPLHADFHRKSLRGARPWSIGGDALRPRGGEGPRARAGARVRRPRSPSGCARFAAERGRPGPDRLRDRHRAARPLVVGGPGLARGGARRSPAAHGIELVTLGEALERHRAEPRPLRRSSWGEGKDLATWDSPAVADLAWAARRLELRLLRGARRRRSRRRRGRARRARAARGPGERLGVPRQAPPGGRLPLPAGHRPRPALLEAIDSARTPPSPRLRNLAPDLSLAPCSSPRAPNAVANSPDPLLGVPAADRGRARAPRAQALRGPRRARAPRSTCSPAAARSRRRRRRSPGQHPPRPRADAARPTSASSSPGSSA